MGFPDPTKAIGEPEEVMREFRRVRDDMREQFVRFCISVSTG
jgi:hypothetical protein